MDFHTILAVAAPELDWNSAALETEIAKLKG